MYQVPSDETIKECRITRDVVEGKGEPLYLRDGEERRSFRKATIGRLFIVFSML